MSSPLRRCIHSAAKNIESDAYSLKIAAQNRISHLDRTNPFSPSPSPSPLTDTYSRKHTYLRISLTERCNLRCFYCMPEEGVELSPKENILTDDEVVRIARIFVKSGVDKIRLTGGEPTVRKGIVELTGRLNELRSYGLKSIGMTSNGISLHRKLESLVQNGLTHLNLSLDTLSPSKFSTITRRPSSTHSAVPSSLSSALANPRLKEVKINVVVVKGINDDEIIDFVELGRERDLCVRFIEFMPFSGNNFSSHRLIPSSSLLSTLQTHYPTIHKTTDSANDTARVYKIPSFKGTFGFISSMSDHFCKSCNRLRVTADGQIKVCLFDNTEISLLNALRSGSSDDEILKLIGMAVKEKKEGHPGVEGIMKEVQRGGGRSMILIGGGELGKGIGGLLPKLREPIASQSFLGSPTIRPIALNPPTPAEPLSQDAIPNTWVRRLPPTPSSFLGSPIVRAALAYPRSTPQHSHARFQHTLTHLDEKGLPSMVNVSEKPVTKRCATASGRIYLTPETFALISSPSSSPTPNATTETESQTPANVRPKNTHFNSKGDVLTTAQLAGIMAAKATPSLIPLCHSLPLSHVKVDFTLSDSRGEEKEKERTKRPSVGCRVTVECEGKTGVEMEALTGVSVALLTVWDMVKGVDGAGRRLEIGEIMVVGKEGGRSGRFVRETRS